ncbi:MAG: 30S ribosomal protein S8 [Candidatus Aenigmatarchaeota archaeon]|nr:MAG: 30S ribosomal protein S8 [Candidatus Aenigmarchaeota archaeon]
MRHDTLADALSAIRNAEHVGKKSCVVPASALVKNVLALMQKRGYVGEYEFVDDGKSGFFRIALAGKINDCGVVRPRFSVERNKYVKWEKRFLPSDGFGCLLVSTSKGVMDNDEAKKARTGGVLVGYIY